MLFRRKKLLPRAYTVAEEAVALLRHMPAASFMRYYIGVAPFVLGLCLFYAHVHSTLTARLELPGYAFGLALLFFWMKAWQTQFVLELTARVNALPLPRPTLAALLSMGARQGFLQGLLLIAALPLTLAVVPIPLLHTLAQHVSTGDTEDGLRATWRRARAAARHQGWHAARLAWFTSPAFLLLVLAWNAVAFTYVGSTDLPQMLFLAGFYIFLMILIALFFNTIAVLVLANLAALLSLAAMLFHGISGMSTAWAETPGLLFSENGFALLGGLLYLVMDPLVKAAFVLRAHYIESIRSGADLRANARRHAPDPEEALGIGIRAVRAAGLLLLGLAALVATQPAMAEAPAAGMSIAETPAARVLLAQAPDNATAVPEASSAVSTPNEQAQRDVRHDALRRAIAQELDRDVYRWRRLSTEAGVALPGPVVSLLEWLRDLGTRILEGVAGVFRAIMEFLSELIRRLFGNTPNPGAVGGLGWLGGMGGLLRLLAIVLLVALALVLVVVLVRQYRVRQVRAESATAAPAPEAVDIEDEAVTAVDLPEDEWLRMARDLAERGDYRLATRALFLAMLSMLGDTGFLALARHKSNLEYERELRMRESHLGPGGVGLFQQSLQLYEGLWYGMHPAGAEQFDTLQGNQERLREHARG